MSTWSARVDWEGLDLTDDQLLTIAEKLDPLAGAVTTISRHNRTSAQLTVEASTLRQATDIALTAVREATHAAGVRFSPTRVDVVDAATFEAELEDLNIPALVGAAEIATLAGVSRQRAGQLQKLAGFPREVARTSTSGPLQIRTQVEDWIQTWKRAPGRPRSR